MNVGFPEAAGHFSRVPRFRARVGRLSTLLWRALGRHIGWKRYPTVACFLPHRDSRWREIRISEAANGNGNISRKAFALPVNCGAAYRAEMKSQSVAAFCFASPRCSLTRESDLLAAEARLVADHSTGAALALQAMAHGYAHWLTLDRKTKVAAATGGVSCSHDGLPLPI